MVQRISVSQQDYLSVGQSTALKGLLALGVLLAHAVPASNLFRGSLLHSLVGFLGYLCVAVFFFLSGYGIMAQYQAKKEQYLKGFLKNRVLSIYFLTLFLILLYGVFRVLTGAQISVNQLWQSFLIGNTIVSNGWYLQILLAFYILWYLTTKYIQKEQLQFTVQCLVILMYMLVGVLVLERFWYQSSLGFLLGVFWQRNKQKLDSWLLLNRKRLIIVLLVSMVAFCITFLLASRDFVSRLDALCVRLLAMPKGFLVNIIVNPILRSIMSCLSALLFVVVVLMIDIICEKQLNCGVWRFLGKYSMEIYVLQGIPLHVFKMDTLSVKNGWLYTVLVIGSTVLMSVAMHPVIRFVTSIPKKYLQRGGQ